MVLCALPRTRNNPHVVTQSGDDSAFLAAFDSFFAERGLLRLPARAFLKSVSNRLLDDLFRDALVYGLANGYPNLLYGFVFRLLRRRIRFLDLFSAALCRATPNCLYGLLSMCGLFSPLFLWTLIPFTVSGGQPSLQVCLGISWRLFLPEPFLTAFFGGFFSGSFLG